nr:hypothetical protein [Comamonas kerstersii]
MSQKMVRPGINPVQASAGLALRSPAFFRIWVAMLSAPPLRSMHTAMAAPKMMMKEMPPSVLPKLVLSRSMTFATGTLVDSASTMDTANSEPKTLNLTFAVR